ncbi:MAG: flippase-like domain-containing protein [Desulfomonile tiedjei]|nr:flippase-like domain-containing protein [Desulfomonile tiedjei]
MSGILNKGETQNGKAVPADRGGRVARAVLGYGIVVAFIGLSAYYVYANRQDFAFVASISLPEAVAAGFLILACYVINAYQMNAFLNHFGLSLHYLELMALTAGMLLGNLIMPMRGGSGGLALYLKKVHGLDFQAFAAIYAGTAVLVALINSALAIVALIALGWIHGFIHPALTVIVVALFVFCLYLSLFPPPVKREMTGLLGLVLQAAHSWHLLTRDRRLLFSLACSLLVIAFALAAAFYLIYRALGMPLSASAVLVTSSLGNVANLIPITPGSLGIFDAVVIQVPQMFGLDPARSLAATLVFRVLSFFWAFALGIPGLAYIVRLGRR